MTAKKQKGSSANTPKASESKKPKKQGTQSNKSTGRFKYMHKIKCLLKANSKVVHFDAAGISLQDSQGDQPLTWIHHFKDGSAPEQLVTLTQKSCDRFMVLTKHSNKLKLYSYDHNGDEPDIQTLLEKGLEEHLFIKRYHEARSVSFECHGGRNRSNYLYANKKLIMQNKRGNDLPDGQNYLFQLEIISN